MNKLIENFGKKEAVSILVCLAYLLQGIATLIYQVSWEQAMETIVGMALPTISIVMSIFF